MKMVDEVVNAVKELWTKLFNKVQTEDRWDPTKARAREVLERMIVDPPFEKALPLPLNSRKVSELEPLMGLSEEELAPALRELVCSFGFRVDVITCRHPKFHHPLFS